jgi:hypothetical protein
MIRAICRLHVDQAQISSRIVADSAQLRLHVMVEESRLLLAKTTRDTKAKSKVRFAEDRPAASGVRAAYVCVMKMGLFDVEVCRIL